MSAHFDVHAYNDTWRMEDHDVTEVLGLLNVTRSPEKSADQDSSAPATDVSPEDFIAIGVIDGRLRAVSLLRDGTYSFVDPCANRHGILYVGSEALELSQAVEELEELMNSAASSEQDFQLFFDRHQDFILTDDHKAARAHLVLKGDDTSEALIPDFVLEPVDQSGLADLLELKLPSAELFVLKRSRMRCSAAVFEACAQLRAYSEFFDESSNRAAVRRKYGLSAYRPRLFLVIGRRPRLDPIQVKKIVSDLPHRIDIRTYDDLLERMKRRLAKMR